MAEYRLVVYDGAIAAMSLPGGATWRWAYQRRRRIERTARQFAPSRSGQMKNSIFGYYEPARPNQIVMEVWCQSDHAIYVHEGTASPEFPSIFPQTANFLSLPPYGRYPHIRAHSVRGQRANPFLANALTSVMRDL